MFYQCFFSIHQLMKVRRMKCVPCSESESDDPVSSPLDALITCEKLVETTPDDTIHESMDYTEVQDTTQKKYFPDSHSEAQTSTCQIRAKFLLCM